ncbi:hypothetical protein NM688_g518 [Phlebia brevispora]|uniref:Uncharacterized protein n=1 Tax=Phlebia brevispora TaxID=194682 RepID=A0ACC1TE41_9APHY|nr:hypothetical protein NM688_g518 [Phlebia brevispora]
MWTAHNTRGHVRAAVQSMPPPPSQSRAESQQRLHQALVQEKIPPPPKIDETSSTTADEAQSDEETIDDDDADQLDGRLSKHEEQYLQQMPHFSESVEIIEPGNGTKRQQQEVSTITKMMTMEPSAMGVQGSKLKDLMAFKAFCTMHAFSYMERREDDHANNNEVNCRSLVSAAMDKHEHEIAQRLMCDNEYAKVLGQIHLQSSTLSQVHFGLSSEEHFSSGGINGKFNYQAFYQTLVRYLKEIFSFAERQALLEWWNRCIFGSVQSEPDDKIDTLLQPQDDNAENEVDDTSKPVSVLARMCAQACEVAPAHANSSTSDSAANFGDDITNSRRHASSTVSVSYKLHKVVPENLNSMIDRLICRDAPSFLYIYPLDEHRKLNCVKPFLHPIIITVLHHTFFDSPKAMGRVCFGFFNVEDDDNAELRYEIPAPLLALAATAISLVVGRVASKRFSTNTYGNPYKDLCKVLRLISEDEKTKDNYHPLLARIFQLAQSRVAGPTALWLSSSGVDRIDLDD